MRQIRDEEPTELTGPATPTMASVTTLGANSTQGIADKVLAADGTVTSLALPFTWPQPLMARTDGTVWLGQSPATTNEAAAPQTWSVSVAGKFIRRSNRARTAVHSEIGGGKSKKGGLETIEPLNGWIQSLFGQASRILTSSPSKDSGLWRSPESSRPTFVDHPPRIPTPRART